MTDPAETQRRARTKIVATIGPACSTKEQLAALVKAGVDVFRLNMAHAEPHEQQQHVDMIRWLSTELDQPIAILVDLSGPKIRLGDVPNDRVICNYGSEFVFVAGQHAEMENELTCTYEPFVDEVNVGDRIMLADGTVSMEVTKKAQDRVVTRVVQRGSIRSRQGINLPGVKLSAPALSTSDYEHAVWAAKTGIDFVGLSFVRAPEDVQFLKDLLRSNRSSARVVAKIEKREALDRLEEIITVADAVMVARGDLGVEIDVAQIAIEQKRIISMCHRFQRPVIIATQMLDSMQDSPRPTRAEATDVANAILDGADACMLSGETAIGRYPLEAVEMMNRIALATETSFRSRPPKLPDTSFSQLQAITRAVVRAAGQMAHDLGAKLVFVASHSGRTALALSQHRSYVPTLGVSTNEATLRQMCLYWGVTPLRGAPARDLPELIRHADRYACDEGYAQKGDRIVIVGGSHLVAGPDREDMASGVHDLLLVHQVEGTQAVTDTAANPAVAASSG
ncbi:MAG: pyruvate kinase [Pirellulales bacterium]